MNIAYITQLTNLHISDKNPVDYVAQFDTNEFRSVLDDHLVPLQLIEWAQSTKLPENALDTFVELRVELFIQTLLKLLPNIPSRIFDSRAMSNI